MNCWVAGIKAEVGHTWFGAEGKNKNARTALSGSFAWNLQGKALVWDVSGSVTDRFYEDFPDGRNDVFFTAGSGLTWAPSDSVTVSAGAEYRKQQSTRETLEYGKYVVVPQVIAKMSF